VVKNVRLVWFAGSLRCALALDTSPSYLGNQFRAPSDEELVLPAWIRMPFYNPEGEQVKRGSLNVRGYNYNIAVVWKKAFYTEIYLPTKPPKIQLSLERTILCRLEELRNY